MITWQYKIVNTKNDIYLQEEINEHGKEGWELITVKYIRKGNHHSFTRLFFKKQV